MPIVVATRDRGHLRRAILATRDRGSRLRRAALAIEVKRPTTIEQRELFDRALAGEQIDAPEGGPRC